MTPEWTYQEVVPTLNGVSESGVLPYVADGTTVYGGGTATGYTGSVIVSGDSSWATVTPITEIAGTIRSMYVAGNYLLIGTFDGGIYRIEIGTTTATKVKQMTTTNAWAEQWSWTSKDNLVFVGEYGNKDTADNARRVYKSDDYGATWAEVYQIYHGIGAHVHKLLLDPYTDILWVCNGDFEQRDVTKLSPPNYDTGEIVFDGTTQPTDGIAFEDYILWVQDSYSAPYVYGVLKHTKSNDALANTLNLSTQFPALAETAYSLLQGSDGAVYFSTHPDSTPSMPSGIWKSYAPFTSWTLLLALQTEGVRTLVRKLIAVDSGGLLALGEGKALRITR